ncbi:PREDICTED: uncharacterized protein LOC109335450 [Lupinus angustifolius]|uniref:uncharacterized protein LOC109335450 n=1 Tax=Lupinus angustifolius TaxID=3871 RepID=UPI00092E78AD|nr:PREDICTED: uncharacterized protein LOC109335450 [Lupinus angustifolius]
MVTLFHDMMHKEIEIYMDDIIFSQKGIEVDLEKVIAIIEMPAPRIEKEVRGFLGRLNYISRFISQLTATCEPIFKLIRKNHAVKWDDDYQSTFEKIKQYLTEPLVLLFEYDIAYVTQKAIKRSVIADYLANQPLDKLGHLRYDFPDENIMVISMNREKEKNGP